MQLGRARESDIIWHGGLDGKLAAPWRRRSAAGRPRAARERGFARAATRHNTYGPCRGGRRQQQRQCKATAAT